MATLFDLAPRKGWWEGNRYLLPPLDLPPRVPFRPRPNPAPAPAGIGKPDTGGDLFGAAGGDFSRESGPFGGSGSGLGRSERDTGGLADAPPTSADYMDAASRGVSLASLAAPGPLGFAGGLVGMGLSALSDYDRAQNTARHGNITPDFNHASALTANSMLGNFGWGTSYNEQAAKQSYDAMRDAALGPNAVGVEAFGGPGYSSMGYNNEGVVGIDQPEQPAPPPPSLMDQIAALAAMGAMTGGIGLGGIGGNATGGWGSLPGGQAVGYGALGTPSSFGFDQYGSVVSGWTGNNDTASPGGGGGGYSDAGVGAPDPSTGEGGRGVGGDTDPGGYGGGNSDGGAGSDGGGGGGSCFVAGTPVLMADGSRKPIELIAVGDKVLSFDEDGLCHGEVEELYVHTDRHTLTLDGIGVTPEHPFLTSEGFRAIGCTNPGDKLIDMSGACIERPLHAYRGKETVHNFSVKGTHTYIVEGEKNSYRVHNEDGKRTGGLIKGDGDGRLEARRIKAHENEYVVRPEATAYYGKGLLDLLNKQQIPREAFKGLLQTVEPTRGNAYGGLLHLAPDIAAKVEGLPPVGGKFKPSDADKRMPPKAVRMGLQPRRRESADKAKRI